MPVGRSYLGNDWESYSGEFSILNFSCKNSVCFVQLPGLSATRKKVFGDYHYELVSFQHSIPVLDRVARFLEQATFGPTRAEIDSFPDSFADWIKSQQEIPPTLHRAVYREHLNHRSVMPSHMGIPTHPCEEGTRYRRYAFSDKDRESVVEVRTDANRKILLVDGQARSVLVNVTSLFGDNFGSNDIFEDG